MIQDMREEGDMGYRCSSDRILCNGVDDISEHVPNVGWERGGNGDGGGEICSHGWVRKREKTPLLMSVYNGVVRTQ